MPRESAIPYGHIAVPTDVLGTALYGLSAWEAAEIERRSDGLRPTTNVCKAVVWLWENGHHQYAASVIGTTCAILRGRRMPGGGGRITHLQVIDAFGAEVVKLGMMTPEDWAPFAEYLRREVPRGF